MEQLLDRTSVSQTEEESTPKMRAKVKPMRYRDYEFSTSEEEEPPTIYTDLDGTQITKRD